MIFGYMPLLFGLLFQQIVINPISCNMDQTPVISIWQIWALGILHTKISTALLMTGPQWWLRQVVDKVIASIYVLIYYRLILSDSFLYKICQDGIRNIDLKYMLFKLIYPVTVCLGLALSVPCVLSRSIAPLLSNITFMIQKSLTF
jgi:E3 ubiquitin-protein ligase MARCH6